MAIIAPSILGADFARLGEEITSAENAGVDFYHLDIMDGHFVPNISFGPSVVKTINSLTDGYLDVHLMLSEPEKFFEDFAKAGADGISFHWQVHPEPVPYAKQLKALGVDAGLVINPDVPVANVLPYLEHFDLFLLMSVYPGFGGQKFITESLSRLEEARAFIDREGLSTRLQIDGGVDASNAAEVVAAGAEILVMGTAFFGSEDRRSLVDQVKSLTLASQRKQ
jgi:ribulose-phosphate 3-epimerase